MQSLEDKLNSLGVSVGAKGLQGKSKNRDFSRKPAEEVLAGQVRKTHFGSTLIIEKIYLQTYQHGNVDLKSRYPFSRMALCVGEPGISNLSLEEFAFLDTETTGLMGGTGTYAFLIGVGKFISGEFHLSQIMMRNPDEEPAQLAVLEELLAPCAAIVTYNGKTFDIPLLRTRYKTHKWQFPIKNYPHIDLLHLARRLWRDRLPSRTLGNIEAHVLGALRTEEDIPGWTIPQLYFDYLFTGDATPLKRVVYHNEVDIVSLAALFCYANDLLTNPTSESITHDQDIFALGNIFADMGDPDLAAQLYNHFLSRQENSTGNQSQLLQVDVLMQLALVYKRKSEYIEAIPLWTRAADIESLPAHVELAMYYEHKQHDYVQALEWTSRAVNLVHDLRNRKVINRIETARWLSELEHRENRIVRKIYRSEKKE